MIVAGKEAKEVIKMVKKYNKAVGKAAGTTIAGVVVFCGEGSKQLNLEQNYEPNKKIVLGVVT